MTNTSETPRKPKPAWALILIPIVLIATCNIYLNTHQENAIKEAPKPGDFFVFRGLLSSGDQPFKLKAIAADTMEFYVPRYEFSNFSDKAERKVYELDKEGKLFDSLTVKIQKSTVDSLIHNSDLGVRINSRPKVYLKAVFGSVRENAVSNTLEKIAGESDSKK